MTTDNPTYTANGARKWAAEHSADLDRDRKACSDADVQMFNTLMPKVSKTLWDSGIWLAERLAEHGANKDQIQSIQMATGQRAFGGDAWQAAVDYANEFAATGDTKEKGGEELAEKRHAEIFGEESATPAEPE